MQHECWMCAEFSRDPLNSRRGSCQVLTDHVTDSRGVLVDGPLYIKACSTACEDFNLCPSAKRQIAEWAAEAAFMRARRHSVEPESVRA